MKKQYQLVSLLVFFLAITMVANASDLKMAPKDKTIEKPVLIQKDRIQKGVPVTKSGSEIQGITISKMELRPCAQGYKAYVAVSNTAYNEGYLVVSFTATPSEDSDGEVWNASDGARMQCLIQGNNIIGMHVVGSIQCGALPQTTHIRAYVQQFTSGPAKVISKRVFKKAEIISELPATE